MLALYCRLFSYIITHTASSRSVALGFLSVFQVFVFDFFFRIRISQKIYFHFHLHNCFKGYNCFDSGPILGQKLAIFLW